MVNSLTLCVIFLIGFRYLELHMSKAEISKIGPWQDKKWTRVNVGHNGSHEGRYVHYMESPHQITQDRRVAGRGQYSDHYTKKRNVLSYWNPLLRSFDKTNSQKRTFQVSPKSNARFVPISKRRMRSGVDSFQYTYPPDRFKCDLCSCEEDNNRLVSADCSSRRLNTFPKMLPTHLMKLEISFNHFIWFNTTYLSKYFQLSILNMSNNAIHGIQNETRGNNHISILRIKVLDLSRNGIRTIDDNSFSAMPHLHTLLLSVNKLHTLSDRTFAGIKSLRLLDLSYNLLQYISSAAFVVVKNIRSLFLNHNVQVGCGLKQLRPEIFQPLKKLEALYIQGCCEGWEGYPGKALASLARLNHLDMDGLAMKEPGSSFRNLTRLTSLIMSSRGVCLITNLTAVYFHNLPYLKVVKLIHCRLTVISPGSFRKLPLLQEFAVEQTSRISMKYLLEDVLKGLRNTSLKTLTLSRIKHSVPSTACPFNVLTGDSVRHLKHIHYLEELNLESNQIALLWQDFIDQLPQSLKIIRLRKNIIHEYGLVQQFKGLRNLEMLDVSEQNGKQEHAVRDQYMGGLSSPSPSSQAPHWIQTDTEMCVQTCTRMNENSAMLMSGNTRHRQKQLPRAHVTIPPNLRFYSAVKSFGFGDMLLRRTVNSNRLYMMNLSNNFNTKWGAMRLLPEPQIVDMSFNDCNAIWPRVFPINNSFVELHLQHNEIGYNIANDQQGNLFSSLFNVSYLDLSNNHIPSLPRNIFKGMPNMKILKLSNNNIAKLDTSFSHMHSLMFLDLKQNSLNWISSGSRDDLDQIASRHRLSLDVTNNPLPCYCDGIELLSWMATTKVNILNKDFLFCKTSTNQIELLGNLQSRVQHIKRYCISNALFIVVGLSAIAFTCLILTGALLFKNRWRFYFWKNLLLAKYYGVKRKVLNNEDGTARYKFDAYIIYDTDDMPFVHECMRELETERGLKLCVDDRDFLVGSYIPLNITSGIQNSKVTVPVISPEYVENEWCEYALQMAIGEGVKRRQTILIPLRLKAIPAEDMNRGLLAMLKDHDVREYPPEQCNNEVRKAFWDAMAREIALVTERNDD